MIFLDNSSSSFFKPPGVINAVTNCLKFLPYNASRSGHAGAIKAGKLIYHTRKRLADYLCCPVDRVIFTGGCTEALNLAIFGTAKQDGHVITTPFEHNSVLRPLFHLSRTGVIRLTLVTTPGQAAAAVRPQTCLIAVNHVSNVTGLVSDIAGFGEVAHKHNIPLLVDAAQSAGHIKIDMRANNISLLALSPHKGLHAVQGAGILAALDGVTLSPLKMGGTGTASSSPIQPSDFPEGFESGTLPLPAIAGLGAGLAWTQANFDTVSTKLSEFSAYLIEKLQCIKGVRLYSKPNVCGIVSFTLAGLTSDEAGDILSEEYDIAVRCGIHCAPLLHDLYGTKNGMIRASAGCTNTYSELDFFASAIREMVGK